MDFMQKKIFKSWRRAKISALPAAALLAGLIAVQGCSHTSDLSQNEVFKASREDVWETLVALFKSYPVKVMDEDSGYIETERLRGKHFWTAPHQKKMQTGGLSAVIKVNLEYERPYSRVYVTKRVYRQSSILSSPEEIPSDLFEERIFLYRLGRELLIRKALKRRKRSR